MTNLPRSLEGQIAIETSVLRYYLQGKGFFLALEAWDFAKDFHTGTRKDGRTPEFFHQVGMCNFASTLEPSLLHPQETYATIFLHDTVEDNKDLSPKLIRDRFGPQIAEAVMSLSKVVHGVKRNPEEVAREIRENPISSVVKGIDRCNNQGSMLGVFSLEKQQDYIAETKDYILPILKFARRRFPAQAPVYENMKHLLNREIRLFEAMHAEIEKQHRPDAPGDMDGPGLN